MKLVTLTAHRVEQLGDNPCCSNLKCGRILSAGEKVYHADRTPPKYYLCRECEESDETVVYILKNYGGRPRRRERGPEDGGMDYDQILGSILECWLTTPLKGKCRFCRQPVSPALEPKDQFCSPECKDAWQKVLAARIAIGHRDELCSMAGS